MSPRLAGFVVTYHRPQTLRETLTLLLAQSLRPEKILVVDNGSCIETRAVTAALADRGVRYLDTGSNLGPAGGAAAGLGNLATDDADLIYWGDDDDPPKTPDTLERLVSLFSSANDPTLGGVGAVGAPFDWNTGKLGRFEDSELRGTLDVDMVAGGSQFIVNAEAVRRIGLPRADFFFGFEDLEFCLRLKTGGLGLLIDGALMLEYRELAGRTGLAVRRSLTPRGPASAQWRQYYSTRNLIFSFATTFDRPDLARRCAARALAKSLASWLRGPRFGASTTLYQVRAILDGYRARLGRRIQPEAK